MASSQPPPSAQPLTAAMTGFVTFRMRSHWPIRFVSSISIGVALAISPMSAPAANARSLPVTTIARTVVVAVQLLERDAQRVHDRAVERVQLLRAVEAHERGALLRLTLDEDELLRRSSTRRASLPWSISAMHADG